MLLLVVLVAVATAQDLVTDGVPASPQQVTALLYFNRSLLTTINGVQSITADYN